LVISQPVAKSTLGDANETRQRRRESHDPVDLLHAPDGRPGSGKPLVIDDPNLFENSTNNKIQPPGSKDSHVLKIWTHFFNIVTQDSVSDILTLWEIE
jgi:hypothetical protein